MSPLDERTQARDVAKRWRRQYPASKWPDRQSILAQLEALDPETATADDFARIIGNRSWCSPATCEECGAETWSCVSIGGDPDDCESSPAIVCVKCLRKAARLMAVKQ